MCLTLIKEGKELTSSVKRGGDAANLFAETLAASKRMDLDNIYITGKTELFCRCLPTLMLACPNKCQASGFKSTKNSVCMYWFVLIPDISINTGGTQAYFLEKYEEHSQVSLQHQKCIQRNKQNELSWSESL